VLALARAARVVAIKGNCGETLRRDSARRAGDRAREHANVHVIVRLDDATLVMVEGAD
jgi:hypothetical protein